MVAIAAVTFWVIQGEDRDEAAFQGYVTRSTPDQFATIVGQPDPHQWEYEWAADHPDVVLAEGDAACRWLADRADATDDDPSGAFSIGALVGTYLRETQQPGVEAFSDAGKRTLVYGAWAHLCPETRDDKIALMDGDED